MKVLCPKCGRTSHIDDDLGDFPMRCLRCGALLRLRGKSFFQNAPEDAELPRFNCIPRGGLAGLLISRSTTEEQDPPVIHAHAGALVRSQPAEGRHCVLRPESRREIHRVRARHQALRVAELKVSQQALGALSWAGLILVALLALGVLVLKAQAMRW
jgi:hypothetical protein